MDGHPDPRLSGEGIVVVREPEGEIWTLDTPRCRGCHRQRITDVCGSDGRRKTGIDFPHSIKGGNELGELPGLCRTQLGSTHREMEVPQAIHSRQMALVQSRLWSR